MAKADLMWGGGAGEVNDNYGPHEGTAVPPTTVQPDSIHPKCQTGCAETQPPNNFGTSATFRNTIKPKKTNVQDLNRAMHPPNRRLYTKSLQYMHGPAIEGTPYSRNLNHDEMAKPSYTHSPSKGSQAMDTHRPHTRIKNLMKLGRAA